jgi:hypothetical protein
MSDPQKMTARELLAILRSGHHNTYLMALGGVQHDARCLAAADLIDALKAENERLRDALFAASKIDRAKALSDMAELDGQFLTASDATTRTDGNGAAPSP